MNWFQPIESTLGNYSSECFGRIIAATYQSSYDNSTGAHSNHMELSIHYYPDYVVTILVEDARGIKIPDINSGCCLRFEELFIDDVSDSQLEGINYHFADEGYGMSFYCAGLQVLSICKFENEAITEQLWPHGSHCARGESGTSQ